MEQVNYKTFEMRIFPANAGAEQKVQIIYYQEFNIDHDRATGELRPEIERMWA